MRIGLDTAKHVFQLHGVDEREQPVLRRRLGRREVEPFFAKLAPTQIGLEACGGAHYWARVLRALGHAVVLLPPQYIKPYLKRGKNDALDAEAICEAMSRPSMRFVPVKSAEQQAALTMLRSRDLLVKQRTMLINAMRGHAAEFGIVAAKGTVKVSDPKAFRSGRHFAAWLGLTPKANATGGRSRPGWISARVMKACAGSWCSAPPP